MDKLDEALVTSQRKTDVLKSVIAEVTGVPIHKIDRKLQDMDIYSFSDFEDYVDEVTAISLRTYF